MDRLVLDAWPWLLAALALLIAGYRLRGLLERARLHRRQRRAAAGERDAAPLLESLGYRVLDYQAPAALQLSVDDEPVRVSVRADYLVERRGKRFVAEVKTGKRAPSPSHPDTRRQLLEYSLAYDVSGVLLVNMEAGRVHKVDFAFGRGQAGPRVWRWLMAGAVLGALAVRALSH